jgi:hypothetical protein
VSRAAQKSLALGRVDVDVTRLVTFTPQPEQMRTRWEVNAAQTRYYRREGTLVGVLQIKNVRGGAGFLIQFDNGEIAAFNDIDLFPAAKSGAAA